MVYQRFEFDRWHGISDMGARRWCTLDYAGDERGIYVNTTLAGGHNRVMTSAFTQTDRAAL